MFSKRADGLRIKGIDPIVQATPYIMPMRCDAQVLMKHRVDLEKLNEYIRSNSSAGSEKLTHMQVIIAAYVRAVSQTPEVNRFIMNKRYYSRNNCTVSFTMLKNPNNVDEGETAVKLWFDPYDTIYDVRDLINETIKANRGDQPKNFLDKLAAFIFNVPGLPTALVGTVRLLDRYNLCPAMLINELPFHSSMFITNTASIRLHDVNHHVYNFGNVGIFLGMGMPEKVAVVESGEARMKRFLPVGVTVDERVCSGAHYARFFNKFRLYIEHPEMLEVPPESVKYDPGCEYRVKRSAQA